MLREDVRGRLEIVGADQDPDLAEPVHGQRQHAVRDVGDDLAADAVGIQELAHELGLAVAPGLHEQLGIAHRTITRAHRLGSTYLRSTRATSAALTSSRALRRAASSPAGRPSSLSSPAK